MISSSQVERRARPGSATAAKLHLRERMRRTLRAAVSGRRARRCLRALVDWSAPVRQAIDRTLQLGVSGDPMPLGVQKRIRLCNINALGGGLIMAGWVLIEAVFGELRNVPLEIGLMAGFASVLALNAS